MTMSIMKMEYPLEAMDFNESFKHPSEPELRTQEVKIKRKDEFSSEVLCRMLALKDWWEFRGGRLDSEATNRKSARQVMIETGVKGLVGVQRMEAGMRDDQ